MKADDRSEPESGCDEPSSFRLDTLWSLVAHAGPHGDIHDPLIGREIGGVTIRHMIAEGGMGRVYAAVQSQPARTVAVKVLRPGLQSRDVLRRFAKEAEILGRLRHPAIAQIYAAGTFELLDVHVPYFVMEYVPEASAITQYARQHALSLDERLDLFSGVVDAVSCAHAHSVIHRDLKPGNILIDAEGRPKVIDFGVARDGRQQEEVTLTQSGQWLGTLQSMSPEQVNPNLGSVDARTDVYALGVVLYELITDQPPYELRHKSVVEAANVIQEYSPRPAHVLRRETPRPVSRVVERCLAKEPTARFANAAELNAALGQARLMRRLRMPLVVWASGVVGCVACVWAGCMLSETARPRPASPLRADDRRMSIATRPQESYSFNRIEDADGFLVVAEEVRLYREWQVPADVYWGPTNNGREGMLVYRFQFPAPTRTVHLFATAHSWDFTREPGGHGRGCATIEASSNGSEWHVVRDGVERRAWGEKWNVDEPIPEKACGTSTVWIRIRLLVEDAPNTGYTTAQFGRGSSSGKATVFRVAARPEDPAMAR